eukprot:scaffold573_cov106-Isochrysis_galbana.AAC.4
MQHAHTRPITAAQSEPSSVATPNNGRDFSPQAWWWRREGSLRPQAAAAWRAWRRQAPTSRSGARHTPPSGALRKRRARQRCCRCRSQRRPRHSAAPRRGRRQKQQRKRAAGEAGHGEEAAALQRGEAQPRAEEPFERRADQHLDGDVDQRRQRQRELGILRPRAERLLVEGWPPRRHEVNAEVEGHVRDEDAPNGRRGEQPPRTGAPCRLRRRRRGGRPARPRLGMCLAGSLRSDRHGLGQKCTFVCVAVAAALWERAGQNGPDGCKGESEHGVQAEGAAPAEPSRDDAREGKREKGGLWSERGKRRVGAAASLELCILPRHKSV